MNERIDHTNYEAWLLDRLEGNLSGDQERALDAFLLQHPELAPDLNELPTVRGIEVRLTDLDKESLKRALPPTGRVSEATLGDQLIARLEGDLDGAQLEALRTYLLDHPEHARSERLFEVTKLVPEALLYTAKEDSKRHFPPQGTITPQTLDDHLVARLEGDLTGAQELALTAYIAAHSEARRSWALMQATRVVRGSLVFRNKTSLKKGGRVIVIGRVPWMQLAAAATVALLLGIGAWLLKAPSVDAPDIVQVAPRTIVPAPVQDEGTAQEDAARNSVEEVVQPSSHHHSTPALRTPAPRKVSSPMLAPVLVPTPLEREEPLPIAQQVPVVLEREVGAPKPVHVAVPIIPPTVEEPMAFVATSPSSAAPKTVGQLFAATVRERVLEQQKPETRPLDRDDAMAMVDRGLKAVAGDRTGLAVERKGDGGVRGFNLRLGRNLAISASR